MKIRHLVLIAIIFQSFIFTTKAQVYLTQTGETSFFSETPMENISGLNKTVAAAMNLASNDIAIRIQNVAFKFPNKLMEEHFNENYVESHKFPKSEFKGKLKDLEQIDFTKDGIHTVKVKGDLTMHGQTKEVETTGKLVIQGGKISANATFNVKLSDFDISIPGLVADKVAKIAKINVACSLEPLKN